MAPSFCGYCRHYIYQHSADGCQHCDEVEKVCEDPICRPIDVAYTKDGHHSHPVPQKCDCRVGHPLLVP